MKAMIDGVEVTSWEWWHSVGIYHLEPFRSCSITVDGSTAYKRIPLLVLYHVARVVDVDGTVYKDNGTLT